jgi:DNA-binding MarR family transcriptional regulator
VSKRTRDHIDGILAQWRRERPGMELGPLGVFGRLFRATQLAEAHLSEPLRERGLQAGWLDVLAALRRAGAPYELNPKELMRATMLSSGGMTKRLDRLVDAGLIERRPDPADRRGTLVKLTRRGKRTIDAAIDVHIAYEKRLLGALSAADRRELDALLRKLLTRLEADEAAGKESVRAG